MFENVLSIIKLTDIKSKRDIQFKLIIFLVLILGCFKILYNGNYVNIISMLFFTYYLTTIYLEQQVNTNIDKNKLIDLSLIKIQKKIDDYINQKIRYKKITDKKIKKMLFQKNQMSSLYTDANMIIFLESISEMYNYNPDEYYLLIKGTNNILKIKADIELYLDQNNEYIQNIHEQLDIATDLRTKCVNNVHNFIYTVPRIEPMNNYINTIILRYSELIDVNINRIKQYSQNEILKNGVENSTKFLDNLDAKPNSTLNSNYYFYN
jgi:hypothetical protein